MYSLDRSAPVIPFEDLASKYSLDSSFSKTDVEKITTILKEIDFSDHLCHENFFSPDTISMESKKKLQKYFSPAWEIKNTNRNAVLSHKSIPDLVVKVYDSRPNLGHPMASILRVPMAHLIQEIIKTFNLDIEVPTKGLISLSGAQIEKPNKYNGSQLNEHTINEAFVVVARKINIMKNPIARIKEFDNDKQEKLAGHACMIPEKTGLADYYWGNITLTDENKLAVIDTEPLYGGVFVNRFGKGYSRCKELFEYWTLEKSAKYGLQQFSQSSLDEDLPIFHEKAQKFLEKHD